MSTPGEPRRRIIVALDPGASSDLPLDIARQLRSTTRTELVGFSQRVTLTSSGPPGMLSASDVSRLR